MESIGKKLDFEFSDTGAYVVLSFDKRNAGKSANVYVDDAYLFSATIGRSGQIKVTKDSEIGKSLLNSFATGRNVKAFI